MGDEGTIVGSASIQIEADLSGFESKLETAVNAAISKVQTQLNALVLNPKIEVRTEADKPSDKSPAGTGPSAGGKKGGPNADVHVDATDARQQLDHVFKDSFKLTFDISDLTTKLAAAFKEAFSVNVKMLAQLEASPGAAAVVSRSPVPVQAREIFNSAGLAGSVRDLGSVVDGLLKTADKTRNFSRYSGQTGKELEQFVEMLETFGEDLTKWVGGPSAKPTGTVAEWLRAQGVDVGAGTGLKHTVGSLRRDVAGAKEGGAEGARLMDTLRPFIAEVRATGSALGALEHAAEAATAALNSVAQGASSGASAPQAGVAKPLSPQAQYQVTKRARAGVTPDMLRPIAIGDVEMPAMDEDRLSHRAHRRQGDEAAARMRIITGPGAVVPEAKAADVPDDQARQSQAQYDMAVVARTEYDRQHKIYLDKARDAEDKVAKLRQTPGEDEGRAPREDEGRAPLGQGFLPIGTPGRYSDSIVQGPYRHPKINRSNGLTAFRQLDLGSSFHEPTSKVHVSATMAEAEQTLAVAARVAEEMGVTFKWVHSLEDLAPGGEFGPRAKNQSGVFQGGEQEGKFITLYPTADQARELVQRLEADLEAEGLGKTATVAPTEKRWGTSPITHRYTADAYGTGDSGDERYASEGGYGPGSVPENIAPRPDFVGDYQRLMRTSPNLRPASAREEIKALDALATSARKAADDMGLRPILPPLPIASPLGGTGPSARRAGTGPSARRAYPVGENPVQGPDIMQTEARSRAAKARLELETDIDQRRALGTRDRAANRRLLNPADLRTSIGGQEVDITREVGALIRGAFSNVVEEVDQQGKGKGIFNQLRMGWPAGMFSDMTAMDFIEQDQRIRELRKANKPYSLPNAGPDETPVRVKNINEWDMLIEQVTKRVAGPRDEQLAETPAGSPKVAARSASVAEELRNWMTGDDSPATNAINKAMDAMRGRGMPTHGETGSVGVTHGDADPRSANRAYIDLKDTLGDLETTTTALDKAWTHLDKLWAGGSTPNVNALDRTEATINRLTERQDSLRTRAMEKAEIAAPVISGGPTWGRGSIESGNLSTRGTVGPIGAASQADVRNRNRTDIRHGIYLTEDELIEKQHDLPKDQAARIRSLIDQGIIPKPGEMLDLVAKQVSETTDRRKAATGGGLTGLSGEKSTASGVPTQIQVPGVKPGDPGWLAPNPEYGKAGAGVVGSVFTDARQAHLFMDDMIEAVDAKISEYLEATGTKGEEARNVRADARLLLSGMHGPVSQMYSANQVFVDQDAAILDQRDAAVTRSSYARNGVTGGVESGGRFQTRAQREKADRARLDRGAQIPSTPLDMELNQLRPKLEGVRGELSEMWDTSKESPQPAGDMDVGESGEQWAERSFNANKKVSDRQAKTASLVREREAIGKQIQRRERVQRLARLRVEKVSRMYPGDIDKQIAAISRVTGHKGVAKEAKAVLSYNLGEKAYRGEQVTRASIERDLADRQDASGSSPISIDQLSAFARGQLAMGSATPDLRPRIGRQRKSQKQAAEWLPDNYQREPSVLTIGADFVRQQAKIGIGSMHPLALAEMVGMPPFGPMSTPTSRMTFTPTSGGGQVPPPNVADPGGTGVPPPSNPPPETRSRGGFDGGRGQVHVIIAGQTQPIRISWEGSSTGAGGGSAGIGGDPYDPKLAARNQEVFKRMSAKYATSKATLNWAEKEIQRLQADDPTRSAKSIHAALTKSEYGPAADLLMGSQIESIGATGSIAARRKRLGMSPVVQDVTSEAANKIDIERADLQAESEAAQRKILRRGFTASVTDIFQSPFFTKQNAAVDRFTKESQQLISMRLDEAKSLKLVEDRTAEKIGIEAEMAKVTDKTSTAYKRLKGDLENSGGAISALRDAENVLTQRKEQTTRQEQIVQGSREQLPGRGRAVANLAIGGTAAAGAFALGSIVFQIAGQVLSLVEKGLEQVAGPAVERVLGYSNTAARVTTGAAEAIRASGGSVGALTGQMAATGMSAGAYNQMAPIISQRAEAQAGNKNLEDVISYMHTAERLREEGQAATGLDKAITQGTGGLLDSWVMGIPSTAELLKDQFIPKGQGSIPLPQADAAEQNRLQLEKVRLAKKAEIAYFTGTSMSKEDTDALVLVNSQLNTLADKAGTLAGSFDKGQERLNIFNEQAKKGGEELLKLGYIPLGEAGDEELARQSAYARAAGMPETFIGKMQESRVALNATNNEDYQRFVAANNLGTQVLSPEMLLHGPGADWARKAQLIADRRQTEMAIGKYIPAGFGMSQSVAPIGALGAPIAAALAESPESKLGAQGQANMKGLAGNITEINTAADEGRQVAKDFVKLRLPEYGDAFASSLDLVTKYGQQISDIQIGNQVEQAAYSAHQFEFSLFQANRSLKDAKGLLSGVGSGLGAINRQQWNLQRESQSLSLGLSQKQINFQKNLAGFVAPGDTAEERAARIEQADIEARYAQKQLDIQKKLFGLAGKGFQITASRGAQDVARQIDLLKEGRTVTLDTAAAEAKIKALTTLQAKENQRVETYYNSAVTRTNELIGEEARLIAATGRDLHEIGDLVIEAYRETYQAMIDEINDHPNGGGGRHSGTTSQGSVPNARGFLGVVTSPTSMLMGDAGDETVAILRNPRQVPTEGFGGGGGQNVIINITGNTVRNDQDLENLAYLIERKLNQKAALLGYRKPV